LHSLSQIPYPNRLTFRARPGKHPKRIVVAQVRFNGEGEALEIVQ